MRIVCDGLGYWEEEGESGKPTHDTRLRREYREHRSKRVAFDADAFDRAHDEYLAHRAESL